jgi:hypothetical protein
LSKLILGLFLMSFIYRVEFLSRPYNLLIVQLMGFSGDFGFIQTKMIIVSSIYAKKLMCGYLVD